MSNKTAKILRWLGALSILFGIALFFAANTLATPMISFDLTPRPVANTVATIHHVSATLIIIGVVFAVVAFFARTDSTLSTQQQ